VRALTFVVMLLAGCAGPVQWEKEGATEAGIEQDSKQCSEKARLAATAVLVPPPIPQPGMLGAPMRQQDQYAMRESQEFGSCMLDKGYKVKR